MLITDAEIDALREDHRPFAAKMVEAWDEYGYLTDRQAEVVEKMLRERGYFDTQARVAPVETGRSLPLAGEQVDAIDMLMAAIDGGADLCGLIGPAGTGKTTALQWLRYKCLMDGRRVSVCATTNPAAGVLRDKGSEDAVTIHKRLGLRPHDDGTKGYMRNPGVSVAQREVVICDEASMADAYLLEAAHKAIRFVGRAGGKPACLVLVGDTLAAFRPVSGEGEMLADFLAIHDAPTAVLDTVRRSGDEMATMLERFREDTWKGEKWPRDVVERGDAEEVLDLFFDVLPENSLIVAYTNSRVMALNARGRVAKYGAERAAAEPYISRRACDRELGGDG